jgi:hypothetical protein
MKLKFVMLFMSLTVTTATTFSSGIISVTQSTLPAVQYGKTEWYIVLDQTFSDPYNPEVVALNMLLTTPSGKNITLPCFYDPLATDASASWKARFTPREAGRYRFRFQLIINGVSKEVSKRSSFEVSKSENKGMLGLHDYWTLRYDNGEPFRGIGMNICWESRDEDDSKYFKVLHEDKRFNYNYMLNSLKANGGNFFRTWMIYWNLPLDWKIVQNNSRYSNSVSTYNESGIKRMDELVELCDSLGIHLMLALESHAGYMGKGWETSNYNIRNGGFARTPTEFFSLPESRQQYKNKLRYMVARYGYSPSIAAWEFFNEVDNAMYNVGPQDQIPAEIVTAWHDEMSTWLKNNDPYGHVVTTSVSHRDIPGMNDLEHLDINQRHIYKNTGSIPSTIREYTQKHKKPYIIGESGYEWDWSKNFNDFAAEMDNDFKKALWYGLFSPTPVLPMSWWWEFFENRDMMKYFSRIAAVNRLMLKAGQGEFEDVNVSWPDEASHALGVKCGRSFFVLMSGSGNNSASTRLVLNPCPEAIRTARYIDSETGDLHPVEYTVQADKSILIHNIRLQSQNTLILILE